MALICPISKVKIPTSTYWSDFRPISVMPQSGHLPAQS